ncbi:MAG: hypothetical protein J6A36_00595 [Clostridia bacterium]|nr:hypothetical protein [Clostridia bacterium]
MYERSAIVLERYFENLFGFKKPNNLVQNYKNYCELFEKFNKFQEANNEEFAALEEFQAAEQAIEDIQSQEEKLYKKNAKYEYNRDLIFNDISQKPDDIEKCMEKIEADIAKTQNSLITLREKFVESVRNYNEKKSALSKSKKARREAEAEYNSIFEMTKQNIENIPEEYIETAKEFSAIEKQEELIDTMLDNGKDEKIPFNNAVVRNAVKVSFDIQKRFIEIYVDAYNKTNKLIKELLEGAVSIELHDKTIRNINVKIDFLNAEKEYLVQFLDYERIMVIHGKRMHRNLMLEACENFNTDIVQIDNLYALLIREITNKSTKKAYKELYNKSYLLSIEENDEKFKKEKNKINLSTATIMNTNYWRIEGIKNIYTVFYKNVVEVFGKTLDEFEVPKEQDDLEENENEEIPVQKVEENIVDSISEEAPVLPNIEEVAIEEPEQAEVIEESAKPIVEEAFEELQVEEKEAPKKKKAKKIKRYTRKKSSKENIISAVTVNEDAKLEEVAISKEVSATQEEISLDDLFDEIEVETEQDIFGEKYKDIDKQIAELDDLDNIVLEEEEKLSNVDLLEELDTPTEAELNEDMPYEDEDIPFEEESIFENIDNDDYEELNLKKIDEKLSKKTKKKADKPKKKGLLKNIMKLNSKDKKKVAAN